MPSLEEVLDQDPRHYISFFPSLSTKHNKFDLNAVVLLKCFPGLGVSSDNHKNYYNIIIIIPGFHTNITN